MLSALERGIVSGLLVATALVASTVMAVKGRITATEMVDTRGILIDSTSHQDGVHNPFDSDPRTAWIAPFFKTKTQHKTDFSIAPQFPFLQFEAGLTHSPGTPPVRNRFDSLLIHSGNRQSDRSWGDYGRPKRIRLLCFREQIVDMDREYRYPEHPVLIAQKQITLPDQFAPVSLPLDFLPIAPESERFPLHVGRIWFRIEIESIYPGKRHPKRFAIGEISVKQNRQDQE